MVDKLNPLARAALAAQLSLSRATRTNKPATTDKGKTAEGGSQREAGAADSSLEQRIARRVAAIDPDDPRRRQKAFRAFIEAQMLNELGAELTNDASFQQLVDDVVGAMEADHSLRREIDEVTQHLLTPT
jgi:hypothetical protein